MKFLIGKRYYFTPELVNKFNLQYKTGICEFCGTYFVKFNIVGDIFTFTIEDFDFIKEKPIYLNADKIILKKEKEIIEQFIDIDQNTQNNNTSSNNTQNNNTSSNNIQNNNLNKPWL